MATLVLSTVGNALGGPVGGAIGALIGQSIDQQLLGSSKRGPRIGDLRVQGSSYGTQVPRIYGTMRVAGSVIWATDLTERSSVSGVKGQPDTTSSYSVSLAVALSSRRVSRVGRIWADGKLLRGVAGDFKVATGFRFYSGDEDQGADPLIASVEGLASAPAYRGLAIAVFENLELAEFGNRIPFMTFEVVADEEPQAIRTILGDASDGLIECDDAQPISGYAAYGQSMRAAVEPLVDSYAVDLFDDGTRLVSPAGGTVAFVSDDGLGNSADGQKAPKIQREQAPARNLPATLRLSYYDAGLDYQSGEARASAGEQRGIDDKRELPAAISAGEAKSLVQQMLAREWARRDKLSLRLPTSYLDLTPGATIDLDVTPRRWSVEQCTIDSFVIVAELLPVWQPRANVEADAGRIVKNEDVTAADVTLALFDIPSLADTSSSGPMFMLAASSPSHGWKSCGVEILAGQQSFFAQTARRKTILGTALNAIGAGGPHLIDQVSSLEVQLIDPDQWLVSCDDEALVNGANVAVLGSELLQFGDVEPLGQGRFRLTRLLRGRGGSEWAMQAHSVGEPFALVEPDALRAVALPAWSNGATVVASCRNVTGSTSVSGSIVFGAENLRPRSPVDVASVFDADGNLAIAWTRRSRNGWAWVDDVDAPLGEAFEHYRVRVTGSTGSIEQEVVEPSLQLSSVMLSTVGTGPATIEVRQIGDWSASRAAEHSLII